MRIGSNPSKDAPQLEGYGRHRIVVPVYIPHLDGYFAQTLEILRLCLESLRLSVAGKANVTIVSNGCTPDVQDELRRQHDDGLIDQLVVNRENRGKVDAVISAARGSFEELVTSSDCDVLFRPGWLEAVEQVFASFPECGYASAAPNPNLAWNCTSATILGALLRGELGRAKVVPDADLDQFAESIGRPDVYKPSERAAQLIVRRRGTVACVGAPHWVCTFRRGVMSTMPKAPALRAYHGEADNRWLDQPPDRRGHWRLSLPQAYAYHLGNTPLPWMYEALESFRVNPPEIAPRPDRLPPIRRDPSAAIPCFVRQRIVSRLVRRKPRRPARMPALEPLKST